MQETQNNQSVTFQNSLSDEAIKNDENKFYERLETVLVRKGFATHRRIRRLFQNHKVELNGKQIFTCGTKFSLFTDTLFVDGKKLELKNDLYILMNKKAGVLCSTVATEKENYGTVYDELPEEYLHPQGLGKLHTVGRLDLDTEGLLVFTTNGDLSHKLCTPEFHVEKNYFVKLRDIVSEEEKLNYVKKCSEGLDIPADGKEKPFFSKPALLEWQDNNSCNLTISEGKFHQVKRMFAALGNEVIYLKRISMGHLELDETLECGQWRHLTEAEVKLLSE